MGRVVWSHPAVRRCVTADVATVGPTVAMVSEGWQCGGCAYGMDGGRWRQEQAAKAVLRRCSFCRRCKRRDILVMACSSLIPERRVETCDLRFVVALQDSLWLFHLGVCLQNWTQSATTAGVQITEGWRTPRFPAGSVWRGTRTCSMTSSTLALWMPHLSVASGLTLSAGTPVFDDLSCDC